MARAEYRRSLIDHGFRLFLDRPRRLRFEDRGQRDLHAAGFSDQLDAEELALADADGPRVLRDRDDGDRFEPF